jgi:hypothetical protein
LNLAHNVFLWIKKRGLAPKKGTERAPDVNNKPTGGWKSIVRAVGPDVVVNANTVSGA